MEKDARKLVDGEVWFKVKFDLPGKHSSLLKRGLMDTLIEHLRKLHNCLITENKKKKAFNELLFG